jgi:diacylglycerol kinase (CTP)
MSRSSSRTPKKVTEKQTSASRSPSPVRRRRVRDVASRKEQDSPAGSYHKYCSCAGSCGHLHQKGIIKSCDRCGRNPNYCFCKSFCTKHGDIKFKCCPEECTDVADDFRADWIVLAISALALLSILGWIFSNNMSAPNELFSSIFAVFRVLHTRIQPTGDVKLYFLVIAIAVAGITCVFYLRTLTVKRAEEFYTGFGVKIKKIARTAVEIERKTFHLLGLGVPILYEFLLMNYGETIRDDYVKLCGVCTAVIWIVDIFRVLVPSAIEYFPLSLMKRIIREKEHNQLSGTCYFSLGCTLSIWLFPSNVAVISICWLVLGDMSAALIGVSIGGESCVVKMGREGKKSVEGSVAMFLVCVVFGVIAYSDSYLSEYAVVIGSLAATLVELYEPFGLNDNITIPVLSGMALQWALSRVEGCRAN